MTLPTTWPTVPVFGTYLRVDGTPNEGSVWFETSQRVVVVDGTGLTIGVVPRRIIADLDATGHFALNLPCTDAGGQPTGWTWQVYERFNSGQPMYSIEVPQALSAQGINLAQYPHAVPVPVAPPVVSYLTTADIGVTVADQVGVDNAVTTANAAATTASAAQAAAASAVTTANDASATANAIDGKATTALANSNAAVTTANAASVTATAAQSTANAIDGKAQSALDASAAATTTANAASATANAIDGKAQSALDASAAATTTANTANATANAASTTANAILPITVAKMLGTASVAGQVPVSQGAAAVPAWGWTSPGFKNWLINGNFDWWQRGTALSAVAGSRFLSDRWRTFSVNTTNAPSQQAFAIGQTAVPNGPSFYHRIITASVAAADSYCIFRQAVESIQQFSGGEYTISFWAKADAIKNIGFEVQIVYGDGSSDTAVATTSFALTANWKYFTFTFVIPSLAGKPTGTGTAMFIPNFWLDCGANYATRGTIGQQSGTFDFAQMQLETGSTATPFERRPLGAELALCQRYYEKSYDVAVAPATVTQSGATAYYLNGPTFSASTMPTVFLVRKRAAPAITVFNPSTGALGTVHDYTANTEIAATVVGISERTFGLYITPPAAAIINYGAHWTADAEI